MIHHQIRGVRPLDRDHQGKREKPFEEFRESHSKSSSTRIHGAGPGLEKRQKAKTEAHMKTPIRATKAIISTARGDTLMPEPPEV